MSEKLQWVFELFDRFSTPAEKISGQLKQVNERLGQAKSAFHDTSGYLSELGTQAGATALQALGLGAAITPIGAVAGVAASAVETMATAVVGLEAALVAGGVALAKYGIQQAAFKETTLASLETILGNKGAASDTFARSVKFAALTPLETKPVVQSMSRLFSAGFNQKQSETLLAFVSDMTSLSGMGEFGQDHLIRTLGTLKGRGKLDLVHLNEIMTVAGAGGLSVGQVVEQLAKARKVSNEAAHALISSGGVSADEGIKLVLDAYRNRLGAGKDVGHASIEQSHTISGLLSTLASRPSEIFLTFDKLGDLPGLKKFKAALENITDALDTTKGAGQEFAQAILGVFSDELTGVFDDLADPEKGPARMATILREAVVVVQDLGAALKVTIGFGKGLAAGLAEGLGLGSDLMEGPFDQAKVEGLVKTFRELGHAIGEALGKLVEMVKPVATLLDSNTSALDKVGVIAGAARKGLDAGIGAQKYFNPLGYLQSSSGLGAIDQASSLFGDLASTGMESNIEAINQANREAREAMANSVIRPEARASFLRGDTNVTVQLDMEHRGEQPEDFARRLAEALPEAIPMAFDSSTVPSA